jgi:hypothetical protein
VKKPIDPPTTVRHRAGIVLTNVAFRCTDCRKWKAAKRFGLRRTADGVIRNQAQCSACRSLYKNRKRPKK